MWRNLRFAGVLGVTLLAMGCSTTIPPKIEVRDVSSGRIYHTYEPWGSVDKGVGYAFSDIETGRRVTLTNYEVRTTEGSRSVSNESVDAKAFAEAKARAGLK